MAVAPRRMSPNPVREYFVLNPDMKREIGGHPIKEKGGQRVVLMMPEQAQFWIDQGVIGDKPGEIKSGAALGHRQPKSGPPPKTLPPAKKKS